MTAIIKNGIRAEHNPVADPRPLPCTVCFDDSYVFPVAHRSGRSRLLKALVRFGNIAGCQVASCLQAETDLGCTAVGAQRQFCLLCLHFHLQCWQISKVKEESKWAKRLDRLTQVRSENMTLAVSMFLFCHLPCVSSSTLTATHVQTTLCHWLSRAVLHSYSWFCLV